MKITDKEIIKALKAGKAIYSPSCMFGIEGCIKKDGAKVVSCFDGKVFDIHLNLWLLEADDWEVIDE